MITFGAKGFRKFLEALPPGMRAGDAGSTTSCPIAIYAIEQGARHPIVAGYIKTQHGTRNVPAWARQFIMRIDYNARATNQPTVTREQALAVLDKIQAVTP